MEREIRMIDINKPEHGVQLSIHSANSTEGDTLWVNVDGLCRLRIVGIKPETLDMDYNRTSQADYISVSDEQRWWLCGLLGAWIFRAEGVNNDGVIALAQDLLSKLEGTDKRVLVRSAHTTITGRDS
jgi:hypothetical protein